MFHIIDDTEIICEMLADMLEDLGYEATSFNCPSEYIKFVRSPRYVPPKAVFTDVRMPIMNGYQMVKQVSLMVPDLKFIIMTGELEILPEHAHLVHGLLRKPFHEKHLEDVLNSLIQNNIHQRVKTFAMQQQY